MISNIIFSFMQFILAFTAHLILVAMYNLVFSFPGHLIPQTFGFGAFTIGFRFLVNGNISQAISTVGCAWIIHRLLAENSALSEAWDNAIKHEIDLLHDKEDLQDRIDTLCKRFRSLDDPISRLLSAHTKLGDYIDALINNYKKLTKTTRNLRVKSDERENMITVQRDEIREHVRRAVIRHGELAKAKMDRENAENETKCLRGQIIFLKADLEGAQRSLRSRQSLGMRLMARRSLP